MPTFELLESRDSPSVSTWTAGGDDDYWSTAENWDSVPGTSSDIVIGSSHTAILDSNVQIANLTFSSGIVTGAYTLTITGADSTWTGGTLAGAATLNVAVDATLTISTSGAVYLDGGATLLNQGTVTWSNDGVIWGASGANVIQNEGDFDIQGDGYLQGGLTIENTGTLTKSDGSGSTTFYAGAVLNNAGAVAVEVGTLAISGGSTGTSTGTFDIEEGATLAIAASYLFTETSELTGAGAVNVISSGSVAVAGDYSADLITSVSGTLQFDVNTTIAELHVGGDGVLATDNTLTITGADSTWTGGSLAGTGTLVVAAEATFTISANVDHTLYGGFTLLNQGLVTWTDDYTIQGGSGDNVIQNEGCFDIQGNGYIQLNLTVENSGTFTKSGGSGTTTFYAGAVLHNYGAVVAEVGTLAAGAGVNHGVLVIHPGAYLTYTSEASGPFDQFNIAGDEVEVEADYFSFVSGHTVAFSATGLPDGLTIDEETGTISGTIATDAGDIEPYFVTITAEDSTADVTAIMNVIWQVDAPVVSFSSSEYGIAEGGTATITVTLSSAMPENVTVYYATSNGSASSGDDYTAASGTVTILEGETSATFTIEVLTGCGTETAENLTITLSSPSSNAALGASTVANFTIYAQFDEEDALDTLNPLSAEIDVLLGAANEEDETLAESSEEIIDTLNAMELKLDAIDYEINAAWFENRPVSVRGMLSAYRMLYADLTVGVANLLKSADKVIEKGVEAAEASQGMKFRILGIDADMDDMNGGLNLIADRINVQMGRLTTFSEETTLHQFDRVRAGSFASFLDYEVTIINSRVDWAAAIYTTYMGTADDDADGNETIEDLNDTCDAIGDLYIGVQVRHVDIEEIEVDLTARLSDIYNQVLFAQFDYNMDLMTLGDRVYDNCYYVAYEAQGEEEPFSVFDLASEANTVIVAAIGVDAFAQKGISSFVAAFDEYLASELAILSFQLEALNEIALSVEVGSALFENLLAYGEALTDARDKLGTG